MAVSNDDGKEKFLGIDKKAAKGIWALARISFGRNCIIGQWDGILHILQITLLICSHLLSCLIQVLCLYPRMTDEEAAADG